MKSLFSRSSASVGFILILVSLSLGCGSSSTVADSGNATADVGPARADVGPTTTPDLGPTAPDLGPATPDLGPATPDLGPATPDLGPATPDVGPVADLGPGPGDAGPRDLGPADAGCAAGVDPALCGLRVGFWGDNATPGFPSTGFRAFADRLTVWRQTNTTGATTLDAAMLGQLDVLVIERMGDALSANERNALSAFVTGGGGLIVLTGYLDEPQATANTATEGFGFGFFGTLQSGPTRWVGAHPISTGLTMPAAINGGFLIDRIGTGAVPGATSIATLDASPFPTFGLVVDGVGSGRVFLWGDELVTLDAAWGPDVQRFWVNALRWVGRR